MNFKHSSSLLLVEFSKDGPVVYPANAFDSRLRGDYRYRMVQVGHNLSLKKKKKKKRWNLQVSKKCFWLMMLCIETSLSVIIRSKSSLQCLNCKLKKKKLREDTMCIVCTTLRSHFGNSKFFFAKSRLQMLWSIALSISARCFYSHINLLAMSTRCRSGTRGPFLKYIRGAVRHQVRMQFQLLPFAVLCSQLIVCLLYENDSLTFT